jgi:hypothetical protein
MILMRRALRGLTTMLALGILITVGILSPVHYSEESILDSTIDDPVFGGLWETQRHVVRPYFSTIHFHTMRQRDRLNLLVAALNATVNVLQLSNIPTFLDAGVLLGWYRHGGGMIPWDIDADVGILAADCLEKYPDQKLLESRIRSLLQAPYVLEYFDCRTDPARDRHFAGIITDKRNGLKVDIFGYHEIDASLDTFSWRKQGSWLQRDLDRDRYHKVVPKDAVLPLQWGNFSGVYGPIIPNDPERALRWDFGYVLDPPIFPHGFARKVSSSPLSIAICLTLILLLGTVAQRIIFVLICLMTGGGYRILSLGLVVMDLCEQGNIRARSKTLKTLKLLCLVSLLNDLTPLFSQTSAVVYEALGVEGYTVNVGRFCFMYKLLCIDT